MYASNLEQLLFDLTGTADVSPGDRSDMARRFDALRRFGRLPQGRQNHASLLNDEQIAAAILGLASDKPNWAGNASLLLGNLAPVGGPEAAAYRASSLLGAVRILLSDERARQSLIRLSLSGAESGINANGFGILKIRAADGVTTTSFVSRLAYHERGSEKTYDHDGQYSPASRALSLNSRFFDRVARDTAHIRQIKPPPISDGSEYDAEEAEQRRREKLGVRPDSRYLMIGVDNQVTWPMHETLVHFDRFSLVLLPKTRDHVQSVSIDLTANKLSMREARTVVNRFLSLITWCDDQFAVAQDGWAGNRVPSPVPRRDLASTTAHHWIFDRRLPADVDTRRALALYREGRNAEQNYLVSFAVLSYYKIIELRHKETIKWLEAAFPLVEKTLRDVIVRAFHEERGNRSVGSHIVGY
ncbi:MAG: hypothetical protein JNM89_06595 [Hyphomicrobiaceae bacterium]|nr:hypothetical protein [Hyphomicrobiaceae bacterium]